MVGLYFIAMAVMDKLIDAQMIPSFNGAVQVQQMTVGVSPGWVFAGVLAGVLGLLFGLRYRQELQTCIREKSRHITELEAIQDPDRSSSGLTEIGTTPPGGFDV
ncbi:hypothetical protein MAIT1_00165 [Magnetofaba australis IT-1]|uniref:Uncharacterized protein n=2 Tax=Magnetofaba TaxID=1472292 RepID=A0A1Y2K8X2_9PROT|nr:hypothetical protein MAIT1_00165 [Magnetofaba australis IT-1]